ncbi:hypothetical protein HDU93_007571 [Gonapodya sp. JEL0774]|nr:hypothetical protein HDU93_007571 [Gonapodya sp. JEL0774]
MSYCYSIASSSPGCTAGRHEPVPDATSTSSSAPKPSGNVSKSQPTAVPTGPSLVSKSESGVETYGNAGGLAGAANPRAPKLETAQDAPQENTEPQMKEEDLNDAPDAVIEVGTQCKRKTCGATYKDNSSREDECVFHPGEAIFHEGSKGYSCCSRKVLEFEEFLKIKGCKTGKHRFVDVKPVKQRVQCRHDFYQTQTTVHISFYAKKIDKEKSSISFEGQALKVNLQFLDGTYFIYDTTLSQPIDPAESKYTFLSTKVEVVLRKRNGISWPAIAPIDNVVSWTTFGGQDAPQEVLAKK